MEKDTNGDCSSIEQVESVDKKEVFWFDQPQISHEVDVEAKEIFGPQVKDLNHGCPNLIELLKTNSSTFVLSATILKAGCWEEWANRHIGKEEENQLCQPPW